MKTIIAGSRDIFDQSLLEQAITESGFQITEVVSGMASGVDTLGEAWARSHGIPVDSYPADWVTYGKKAGSIRNAAMAKSGADALIAVTNGSPGTANMIKLAKKAGLKVHVKEVPKRSTEWDHLVVHCRLHPYDVYIGRGVCPKTLKAGKWGNPWSHTKGAGRYWVSSVAEAVYEHRKWVDSQPELISQIKEELRGKVLGCWCRKKGTELCHGLHLAYLANQ